MYNHRGFIVRSYSPNKQKIVVFDSCNGNLEAVCQISSANNFIQVGFLINYALREKDGRYYIDQIQLEQACLEHARHDIYFLHYVLELCFYMLPFHCPNKNIFDLLLFLMEFHWRVQTEQQKQLFLLKFFVYLGIYPEDNKDVYAVMHDLLSMPMEVMLEKKIELPQELIARWLAVCIQEHPHKKRFKLLHTGYHNVY